MIFGAGQYLKRRRVSEDRIRLTTCAIDFRDCCQSLIGDDFWASTARTYQCLGNNNFKSV